MIHDVLENHNTKDEVVQLMMLDVNEGWVSPIIKYLTNEQLSEEKAEVHSNVKVFGR